MGYLFWGCLLWDLVEPQTLEAIRNATDYPPEVDGKTLCWMCYVLSHKTCNHQAGSVLSCLLPFLCWNGLFMTS